MNVPEMTIHAAYAVIEQAAERIVITDRQGTIVYVNPTFERVTGFSRAEALGQTPRIVKSGHHTREFYQQLWSMLLDGQPFRARFVNKRKNGELYHEEQTIAPLTDKQGHITYFISTAVDLTSQVKSDDARRLAEDSARILTDATWIREDRVVQLKQEVNQLLQEMGRAPKYSSNP